MSFSYVEASQKGTRNASRSERKSSLNHCRFKTHVELCLYRYGRFIMRFIEKKHGNETAFFDQFDKSHWNGVRNCWLSSELGAGIALQTMD